MLYRERSEQDTGGGIAGHGFNQNIALLHAAVHNALQQHSLSAVCHDDGVLLGNNALEAFNRIVEHDVIAADIEQLLGNLLPGQRPEPGAPSAGKDGRVFIHDGSPGGQWRRK